jgi:PadR family transcriptional regulator PadR
MVLRKSDVADLVPIGSLEEQVLLAVIRTGREAYGMNVRRELEEVTGRDVTIGSVYITLDRLEAKGLVSSLRTTAVSSGSSRRVFAVTALGRRALVETRAMRDRLWAGAAISRALGF